MSLKNFSKAPRTPSIRPKSPGRSTYFGAEKNYQGKAPKGLGGLPAPAVIAKSLGLEQGTPIHQNLAAKLVSHPDPDVAKAAKALMKKY